MIKEKEKKSFFSCSQVNFSTHIRNGSSFFHFQLFSLFIFSEEKLMFYFPWLFPFLFLWFILFGSVLRVQYANFSFRVFSGKISSSSFLLLFFPLSCPILKGNISTNFMFSLRKTFFVC